MRLPGQSDESWAEAIHCNGCLDEAARKIAWRFKDAGLPVPEECTDPSNLRF